MNRVVTNVVVGASIVLLVWTGCGDDEDQNTDPGPASSSSSYGSTGTSTASATASSSASSSTSTGAGATGPGCDDVPSMAPSNGVCASLGTGGAGGGAGGAGTGGTAVGGAGGAPPPPSFECNPVTNEGCNGGAGEACDLAGDSNTFTCFPSGNTQTSCQMCENQNGPWCVGTFTCYGGRGICRRYCCDDSDCGPTLTCDKTVLESYGITQVGICLP